MINFLFAGIDFLLNENQKVYFLEANSTPGGLKSWKKVYKNLEPLEKLKEILKRKNVKTIAILARGNKERLETKFHTRKKFLSKFFDVRLCSIEENQKNVKKNLNLLKDVDGRFFKFDCLHLGNFIKYEPKNVLIINSYKIMKITRDKWKFYLLLKKKFNLPKTFLIKNEFQAKKIVKKQGWNKFVVKPRYGEKSKGIQIFEGCEKIKVEKNFLLQEYIEPLKFKQKFWSYRAWVVGYQYTGTLARCSGTSIVSLSLNAKPAKPPFSIKNQIRKDCERMIKYLIYSVKKESI